MDMSQFRKQVSWYEGLFLLIRLLFLLIAQLFLFQLKYSCSFSNNLFIKTAK